MSASGFSSLTPMQINFTNTQWIVSYASTRNKPQCLQPSSSATAIVSAIGDTVISTNQCYCSFVFSAANTNCNYYTIDPAANLIYLYSCGVDSTCRSGCSLVSAYPASSPSPCSPLRATSGSSASDFTSSVTWDSSFNTSYFAYSSYSGPRSTCSTIAKADRIPIYPNCTQVSPGIYALTLNNTRTGNLDNYGCSDPGCSTCRLSFSTSLYPTCAIDARHSSSMLAQFAQTGLLSDPKLVISRSFPNVTSIPPPFTVGGLSIGIFVFAIILGLLMLIVIVYLACSVRNESTRFSYFSRQNRSQSQGQSQYRFSPTRFRDLSRLATRTETLELPAYSLPNRTATIDSVPAPPYTREYVSTLNPGAAAVNLPNANDPERHQEAPGPAAEDDSAQAQSYGEPPPTYRTYEATPPS